MADARKKNKAKLLLVKTINSFLEGGDEEIVIAAIKEGYEHAGRAHPPFRPSAPTILSGTKSNFGSAGLSPLKIRKNPDIHAIRSGLKVKRKKALRQSVRMKAYDDVPGLKISGGKAHLGAADLSMRGEEETQEEADGLEVKTGGEVPDLADQVAGAEGIVSKGLTINDFQLEHDYQGVAGESAGIDMDKYAADGVSEAGKAARDTEFVEGIKRQFEIACGHAARELRQCKRRNIR